MVWEGLKMEFNHNGTIKVPESCKPKLINLSKTIILEYKKEDWGDTIDCKFIITLPRIADEEFLRELESWVDDRIKTDSISTSIEIEKLTPNKFNLLISGKGKDNRCTWCRSFRTSLKTLCNKKNLDFLQKNFCKFEK